MLAYEFYWHDNNGESHLVGILPERRKDPNRITEESILKWANMIIGDTAKANDIFFSKVIIDEF